MTILSKLKKFIIDFFSERKKEHEFINNTFVEYVYFYVSCDEKDVLLHYGYQPFHIINLPDRCTMIFVINCKDIDIISNELEAKHVQFYLEK